MRIASRLWLTGLAAIFVALPASPAHAVGDGHLSSAISQVTPLPDAGWHGRPIRDPQPPADAAALASGSRRGAFPLLRLGDGYERAGGSAAVRTVQRLLRRIGYRCGPVDGLFGPLTRASVQWFQIKHGLRPTGVVGPATLAFLRARAKGEPVPPRAGPPLPGGGVRPAGQAVPARHGSPSPSPAGGQWPITLLLIAGAGTLALAGGTLVARARRAAAPAPAAVPPAVRRPAPRPASAVGYATGRDRMECRRRAQAIERACSERGWSVARVVREERGGGRRGLAFALEQLSQGAGTRLVTCRLEDVGGTRRDLASVLRWCAKSRVDLVALDVGLDTGTSEGRLAARCLLAVGDGTRNRNGRNPPAPREGRRPAAGGGTAPAVSS